jgi:hypothetical protein
MSSIHLTDCKFDHRRKRPFLRIDHLTPFALLKRAQSVIVWNAGPNAPSGEVVKDRFATAFGGDRYAVVLDNLSARRARLAFQTMTDCALARRDR